MEDDLNRVYTSPNNKPRSKATGLRQPVSFYNPTCHRLWRLRYRVLHSLQIKQIIGIGGGLAGVVKDLWIKPLPMITMAIGKGKITTQVMPVGRHVDPIGRRIPGSCEPSIVNACLRFVAKDIHTGCIGPDVRESADAGRIFGFRNIKFEIIRIASDAWSAGIVKRRVVSRTKVNRCIVYVRIQGAVGDVRKIGAGLRVPKHP